MVTGVAGLVGACAWAQWIEGSSRLRRPFGFYGGFIAVALTRLLFEERWILPGAHTPAAPWMQALCGCAAWSTGAATVVPRRPAPASESPIPAPRVTRFSELAGVPIHSTQLYSILSNVVLGLVLARLWDGGSPLSLIYGDPFVTRARLGFFNRPLASLT